MCVAAIGCFACAGSAAAARTPLQLGIQDDALLLPAYFGYRGPPSLPAQLAPEHALDEAAALGVSLVKLKAQWSSLEVRPGEVDSAVLSDAVELARSRGMRVMVLLTGPAPAWATPARRASALRPDPAAFGRFAAAVATALAGRVESYAVWNEPNWPTSLRPRGEAAARYRWLYGRAYSALRSADPAARIVFGNLAPLGAPEAAIAPLRFLRAVLCLDRGGRPRVARACPPLQADSVGLHPYTLRWRPEYPGGPDDATTGSLRRFVSWMDRFAAAGVLRTPSGGAPALELLEWGFHARFRRIPEALRRRYVIAGLTLVCREPRVRSLVWYQLGGPPRGRGIWDTGLLSYEGRRRPTFTALQTLAPSVCPLTPEEGPA
jgi:hypothetical protein